MNPVLVAKNRTARLVREANTPVYTTETRTPAQARAVRVAAAAELAVTEDFCHICGRATDHFGEHTDEQILAWAAKPGLLQRLL